MVTLPGIALFNQNESAVDLRIAIQFENGVRCCTGAGKRVEYETFGAHVMGSGQQDANGVCLADKGALEWVDHRPEMEVNGHPLNLHATEVTFAEVATDASCTDGAVHWGGKLRVQNTGQSDLDFEVWDCDNGEPGRNDGFAISVPAIDYAVQCFTVTPADPTCYLTGGNRQFHPTH